MQSVVLALFLTWIRIIPVPKILLSDIIDKLLLQSEVDINNKKKDDAEERLKIIQNIMRLYKVNNPVQTAKVDQLMAEAKSLKQS